jgi:Arc/MetJ-type ribon-helix-helix transcriptional regulator
MTDMKRVTISIPHELDEKILNLRKSDDKFLRSSYSEIVREILKLGITTTAAPERNEERTGM